MLGRDGDRRVALSRPGPTVQPVSYRDASAPGPELRLSDAAMSALAGLMGIATALDGRRPSAQASLPGSSLPTASHTSTCQSASRRAEHCRVDVALWSSVDKGASVDRVGREHLPTADDSTDAWPGIGQGDHRQPGPASRILFALTDGPGGPEVEVGSAWFA